jgi:RHS repeat-associated protein
MAGDPVFIKNGEYRLYATDLYTTSRSLPVEIKRTYGSRYDYNSRFGIGWDFSFNMKVRRLNDLNDNVIALLTGKGGSCEYTRDTNNPNTYRNPIKPTSYFEYNDVNDTFTLVERNGTRYAFDITDKLSSITDNRGSRITFTYDPNGLLPVQGPSESFLAEEFGGPAGGRGVVAMAYKLIKITDDLGRDINLQYNDDGLLETITDFAGRTWEYAYDSNTNDLLAVTGPATEEYPSGLTTSYDYDDPAHNADPNNKHNLTLVVDPKGQTVAENFYNSDDRIWKQAVGDGFYVFDHNEASNTLTITDRQGHKTEMAYNDNGQLVRHTAYTDDPLAEPNSFKATYVYDPNTSQRIRIIYPSGSCTDYTYDSLGNVTGVYRKADPNLPNDNNNPNVIGTLYTYDANFVDKIRTVTNAMGNVTAFDYNSTTGLLEKITYPIVSTPQGDIIPVQYYTYNIYGQIETVTGPDGMVTKLVYYDTSISDPNYGRLWKTIEDFNTTDGLNLTTEYKYDILGQIYEIKDPNGNATKFEYNSLNKLAKTITPAPFNYVKVFSYDENGSMSRIEREKTDANQITQFSYNILNKIETVTNPLGYQTVYGYNKNGEPNIVTDAELNSTKKEYNERGLLTKVIDANGGVTEYSYTLNGQLAQIEDANGNVTKYGYDGFDRPIYITYPNNTNEVFTYDKNSNITSKKNRAGQTIYYEYDKLDRRIVKNRPGEPDIIIRYDVAGRIYDVNDNTNITRYSRDRIGRVIDINDPQNRLVGYEYDDLGRRTKLVYPDDSNVTYEYDALSRLKRVKYNGSTIAEYEYDELSRRTLLTLGNDANTVYQYDLGDRLTKLTNNLDDTNSITFEYASYDKLGNRLSMKINDANTYVYTYDNLYQLTNVDYPAGLGTDANYYYDKLGNRTSVIAGSTTNYLHNKLNQYDSVGGTSYSYDLKGNLINDGTYKYYYDCENRLTDVNSAADARIASYKYDYRGRRVKKIVYGSPDVMTTYCYAGGQIIAEYEDGTLVRKFVYGPRIDEPICMIDVTDSNKIYYYHFDGLGSVAALSDSSANIVEKYRYDVFGATTIRDTNDAILTTSAYANRYLFTGREYEPETGLYYYRARYYEPRIGRFLSRDMVGVAGRVNLYVYVRNNPINHIDPTGLKCDWKAIAGCIRDEQDPDTVIACADCIGCLSWCWGAWPLCSVCIVPCGACGISEIPSIIGCIKDNCESEEWCPYSGPPGPPGPDPPPHFPPNEDDRSDDGLVPI